MHDVFLINCFCTTQKDSGNEAAVVIGFDDEDSARLKLAKKLSRPVTVFISDITQKEPVLKFFYPNTQMPVCLHGTLAAAKLIYDMNGKETCNF